MLDFDRVSALAKERGWKRPYICERIGKNRNWIAHALRGNAAVRPIDIQNLADLFGVNPEYLTGESDELILSDAPSEVQVQKEKAASQETDDFQRMFNSLTDDQKRMVIANMQAFAALNRESESSAQE